MAVWLYTFLMESGLMATYYKLNLNDTTPDYSSLAAACLDHKSVLDIYIEDTMQKAFSPLIMEFMLASGEILVDVWLLRYNPGSSTPNHSPRMGRGRRNSGSTQPLLSDPGSERCPGSSEPLGELSESEEGPFQDESSLGMGACQPATPLQAEATGTECSAMSSQTTESPRSGAEAIPGTSQTDAKSSKSGAEAIPGISQPTNAGSQSNVDLLITLNDSNSEMEEEAHVVPFLCMNINSDISQRTGKKEYYYMMSSNSVL